MSETFQLRKAVSIYKILSAMETEQFRYSSDVALEVKPEQLRFTIRLALTKLAQEVPGNTFWNPAIPPYVL
jgi:hypothetical protein